MRSLNIRRVNGSHVKQGQHHSLALCTLRPYLRIPAVTRENRSSSKDDRSSLISEMADKQGLAAMRAHYYIREYSRDALPVGVGGWRGQECMMRADY